MPVIAPPTLTPAGLSPDRADRPTFVARSIARDDFIKNTQIPELQAAINNVYNNAQIAYESGTTAASAASAQAADAWVSGTTYSLGAVVWSPITFVAYRRIVAGAGTTDPSADGTNWAAIITPIAAGGTGASTANAARLALGINQLLSIDYTLSGSALTLKLNPTSLDFRSTTLTNGVPINVSFPTQVTTTISSGSTGGTVSGVQSDLYILALSTGDIGWTNAAGGLVLNEQGLINTTAEGGAGAADSATTIYSTTARTGVAYRVVGLFRSTQTTAGTWAQTPSLVQGIGGRALASKLLQNVVYQTGAFATGATTVPFDNTIPQNTEGDQFMSLSITPSSASSTLEIVVSVGVFSLSAAGIITCSLFKDSVADALAVSSVYDIGGAAAPIVFKHTMLAGTASPITFKVRAGGNTATLSFNGISGSARYGGVIASSITIKEYAA